MLHTFALMTKAITIKNLRNELDITQRDFCNFLSVKQSYLAMMERYRRAIPPAVADRIEWTAAQVSKSDAEFDKKSNQHILSNKFSVQFAWKTLAKKKFDLGTAEIDLTVLLRQNSEFARRVYLLEKLRPMPGLKLTSARVFTSWKKYQVRRAGEKLEAAGPEVILQKQIQIAALKAEIHCLEEHLGLSEAKLKKTKIKVG